MKNTHKILGIFYYVFFSFVMLYPNSINAQQKERKALKEVSDYFGKLKNDGIQVCLDHESELLKVIKQKKNKEVYEILMKSCNAQASHYELYATDTKNLLSTVYKNINSDFIIVNMIDPNDDSTLVSKSTLTFSRKRNERKINIIYNHYEFDESNNGSKLIKDSLQSDSNLNSRMELIEDYLYDKRENAISEKTRDQPATKLYYVVAKINGEFLIKRLLDYTSETKSK